MRRQPPCSACGGVSQLAWSAQLGTRENLTGSRSRVRPLEISRKAQSQSRQRARGRVFVFRCRRVHAHSIRSGVVHCGYQLQTLPAPPPRAPLLPRPVCGPSARPYLQLATDVWRAPSTSASTRQAALLRAVPWMPPRPNSFLPFPVAQLIIEYAVPHDQEDLLDRLETDLMAHGDICQVPGASWASAAVDGPLERAR